MDGWINQKGQISKDAFFYVQVPMNIFDNLRLQCFSVINVIIKKGEIKQAV